MNDGRMKEEASHRIGEERKASGALQKPRKNICISSETTNETYEGIIKPSFS